MVDGAAVTDAAAAAAAADQSDNKPISFHQNGGSMSAHRPSFDIVLAPYGVLVTCRDCKLNSCMHALLYI